MTEENDGEHFCGKVAQKALICKDDSVLIVRHPGSDSVWGLPGGRLHIKEDPKTGLQREIQEELGISITVKEIVSLEQFTMKRTGEPHLAIVYKALLTNESAPLNVQSEEIVESSWVNSQNRHNYQLFSNYKLVLEGYFSNLT